MENKLFKIKRKKFFNSLDYITTIKNIGTTSTGGNLTGILKVDFTDLIGRDLTLKEKADYIHNYEGKDIIYLINIIFNDYFEHRLS